MRMQTHEDVHAAVDRAVRSHLVGHPLGEDALQEAHIATWQALEAGQDLPLALQAGRWRASHVARGQAQFGALPRSQGSGSRIQTFASYEALADTDWVDSPRQQAVAAYVKAFENAFLEEVRDLLTEQEWTIVRMMMDGHPHSEIAPVLGVSLGTVRSRMTGIRHKLRPFWEEWNAA